MSVKLPTALKLQNETRRKKRETKAEIKDQPDIQRERLYNARNPTLGRFVGMYNYP